MTSIKGIKTILPLLLGMMTYWLVFVANTDVIGVPDTPASLPDCPVAENRSSAAKLTTRSIGKGGGKGTASPFETCPCDPQPTSAELLRQERTESSLSAIAVDDREERMGRPLVTQVLARGAYRWLREHWGSLFDVRRPRVVFDYGFDLMEYDIAVEHPEWVFLTALLVQDSIDFPTMRAMPRNHIQLSPPILHRLKSWFTTRTLVDVQFALRIDELLNYAIPMDIWAMVSDIISMGKITFLVLPCTGFSDLSEEDIIHRAIARRLRNRGELGIHHISIKIEKLKSFSYESCTRSLLKVTLVELRKGVRSKWCYYPDGWAYNLWYHQDKGVLLARHNQSGVVEEVTTIHGPSVGLADVLGWGVTRVQRESWVYEMLAHPVHEDPRAHRWSIGKSGVLVYDEAPILLLDSPSIVLPVGVHYLELLRLSLCVGDEQKGGNRWKQVVNSTGGLEWRTAKETWAFAGGKMLSRRKGVYYEVPRDRPHAEIKGCPKCQECIDGFARFNIKGNNSPFYSFIPPPPCVACSNCVRDRNFADGTPIWEVFYGCLDVDGVTDNGDRTEAGRCDAVDVGPLRRPTRPGPLVLSKGE